MRMNGWFYVVVIWNSQYLHVSTALVFHRKQGSLCSTYCIFFTLNAGGHGQRFAFESSSS